MTARDREPLFHEYKIYHQILKTEPNSSLETNKDTRQQLPLLELQIELENGNKVYINPQPCDQPLRLATQFCEEHNLDTDMIDILAQSIKKSLHRSHESCSKESLLPQEINQKEQKKLNYISKSCKTNNGSKSPQYFSKKFSVNSSLGLYQKGIMRQDAKKHWIARQNQHKILEQMRQCTHQPKINKLSKSLISQRLNSKDKIYRSIENVSVDKQCFNKNYKDAFSIRSSILVSQQDEQRTPLNQRKSESNINNSNSSSVFLKLYQNRHPDEISRSKILSQVLKQQTHHPSINNISKQIIGSTKFSERLIKYEKDRLEKYYKLKKTEMQEKQNMHKPKTGPAPPNRNAEGLPIGEFLYNKKKKPLIVKKIQSKPSINQTSKIIYQKRKSLAFSKVFDHLDTNKIGKIDWNTKQKQQVDPDLVSILRPLLEQIEIMKIELNKDDFSEALNFLYKTLSPIEKDYILNFGMSSKPNFKSVILHTVQINKRSQQIARSIGRSKFNIYDYCQIKQTIRLQKIQNQRIQNERKQMKQCTFEPNIQRKPIYY